MTIMLTMGVMTTTTMTMMTMTMTMTTMTMMMTMAMMMIVPMLVTMVLVILLGPPRSWSMMLMFCFFDVFLRPASSVGLWLGDLVRV